MSLSLDLRVVELLCSRLCHDLVSPIGAVNNGIELVWEFDTDPDPEAMDLIADSARNAARRLQFFRMAYGLAGGKGVELPRGEIRLIASEFLETEKAKLEWYDMGWQGDRMYASWAVKLLLNMILLANETLPRGGHVEVHLERVTEGSAVTVKSVGAGARVEDGMRAALEGTLAPEDLTAQTVHAYFTARCAEAWNTDFRFETAEDNTILFKSIFRGVT